MQKITLIDVPARSKSQTRRPEGFSFNGTTQKNKLGIVREVPLRISGASEPGARGSPFRSGDFFEDLSDKAITDLELVGTLLHYPTAQTVVRENQEPRSFLLLLDGSVKLSINSQDGKRLILGTAKPGEILGLASAVSASPYEMTVEAQFPCVIQSIPRPAFFDLLMRYPNASQNVSRQLCSDYKRMHQQLRTLGLSSGAPAKLGCLLLDWCIEGEQTVRGTRILCSLTHGEIAECIGASRETVTRALNRFKNEGLVELHGSTLIVPSPKALAIYVGICNMPDPNDTAA